MEKFNELLRSFDLKYFGAGQHKITLEEVMKLRKDDKVFFLDVRTMEEVNCVNIEFAKNIPTHEIPDRINEIPKDKIIAVFCSSGTRATIVSAYLQVMGYSDVKILLSNIGEIAGYFKPGYVLKNLDNLSK